MDQSSEDRFARYVGDLHPDVTEAQPVRARIAVSFGERGDALRDLQLRWARGVHPRVPRQRLPQVRPGDEKEQKRSQSLSKSQPCGSLYIDLHSWSQTIAGCL